MIIVRYMPNYSAALDDMFSALANPARRKMIETLSRGPSSMSELARPLKMALPSVMQHLRLLEKSGLVTSRKVGRVRTYWVEPKRLDAAQAWLGQQRAHWEARFDRMDAIILESENKDD